MKLGPTKYNNGSDWGPGGHVWTQTLSKAWLKRGGRKKEKGGVGKEKGEVGKEKKGGKKREKGKKKIYLKLLRNNQETMKKMIFIA